MRIFRVTMLAAIVITAMTTAANATAYVCRPGHGCFLMYKYSCAQIDLTNFPGILCADYDLHVKPGSSAQSFEVNGRAFPVASAALQQLVVKSAKPKGDSAKLASQLDKLMATDPTVIPPAQANLVVAAPNKTK